MAFVHTSVNKVSTSYFQNERRFNYTTPKSFLEQILLYRKLLKSTTVKISSGIHRFQTGLQKLLNCAQQVIVHLFLLRTIGKEAVSKCLAKVCNFVI